jgi:hypothetical protein
MKFISARLRDVKSSSRRSAIFDVAFAAPERAIRSISIGVFNWPSWRHIARFPQYIKTASILKWAG